jgi:type IV secretion system protein VirB11
MAQPAKNTTVLDRLTAPLRGFLAQEGVTEVVINKPFEIGVETQSGWTWYDAPSLDYGALSAIATTAAAFTHQDVGERTPICSTILPTGERMQIVVSPTVESGTVSLTIRKPSNVTYSLQDFKEAGLFNDTAVAINAITKVEIDLLGHLAAHDHTAFFDLAVKSKRNILISGATGSGKTTLAKGLIGLIPQDERLITIEDTRELMMPHRNVVHMTYSKDGQGTASVTAKQLLESALRMRPDRILLAELRDGTAYHYLRNVNSGHPGSITTVHADSARLAFEQLTLLVKESEGGSDLARDDIRAMLTALVDIVVQIKKTDIGFRVTEIYYDPQARYVGAH